MPKEKTKKSLVSIVVITYNSSKFVLKTLESAKAQTYQNIELIVSDDCSKDDTVKISNQWIEKNKRRFVKTKLITSDINKGIANNCNKGIIASSGNWVKFIAGDDYLYENCINEFIISSIERSDTDAFFSDVAANGNLEVENAKLKFFFDQDNVCRYKMLLNGNILPAPAFFVKRKLLLDYGGFDEKIPLLEDYPLFLKMFKNKEKIGYINKKLVYYRVYSDSLTFTKKIHLGYHKSFKYFLKEYFLYELLRNKKYAHFFHYCLIYILQTLTVNKIIKNRSIYDWFIRWFSVLVWQDRLDGYKSKR